jgi:hypothetical protein
MAESFDPLCTGYGCELQAMTEFRLSALGYLPAYVCQEKDCVMKAVRPGGGQCLFAPVGRPEERMVLDLTLETLSLDFWCRARQQWVRCISDPIVYALSRPDPGADEQGRPDFRLSQDLRLRGYWPIIENPPNPDAQHFIGPSLTTVYDLAVLAIGPMPKIEFYTHPKVGGPAS